MCHIYIYIYIYVCFSYLLGVLCFSYMFYSFCSLPCDILNSRYKREITRCYTFCIYDLTGKQQYSGGDPRELLSSQELGDHHEVRHEERTHLDRHRPKNREGETAQSGARLAVDFFTFILRRWFVHDSGLCEVIDLFLEGSSYAHNFSCIWPLAICMGLCSSFWWQ